MDTLLKPNNIYFKKQIYIASVVTVTFYLFFIPFCLFILGEEDSGYLVLKIGSVVFFILCFLILFFEKLWINNLSYIIKDSNITIFKGIFTKIQQNIPNNKVTDFVLYRDIFDRFLGIGSIKVQTAGASGESGFEGVLDGLLDYEKIHKSLREKLVNPQNSYQPDESSNLLDGAVLSDILSELKEINKKM